MYVSSRGGMKSWPKGRRTDLSLALEIGKIDECDVMVMVATAVMVMGIKEPQCRTARLHLVRIGQEHSS